MALRRDVIVDAASAPTSPAGYARAFANRVTWSGGDRCATIGLRDGGLLWLFGDTFVGGLKADGTPRNGMLRNSLVLQDGGRFEMLTAGDGPGKYATPLVATRDDEWLWPMGGVATLTHVKILCLRLRRDPGVWGFTETGTEIVILRLSDWKVTGQRPTPMPEPDVPIDWTGSVSKIGRYVYVSGWRNVMWKWRRVLARTTVTGFEKTPWLFWDGGTWSEDINSAADIMFEDGPFGAFWMQETSEGVLASARSFLTGADPIKVWTAPSPAGPYRRVHVNDSAGPQPGWFGYAGRIQDLPGVGLATVWSENAWPDTRPYNANNYGPHFAAADV